MITGSIGCSRNVVLHIVERRARLRNNLLDADTQTVRHGEPELTSAAVAVAIAVHASEVIAVPIAAALSSSLQQLRSMPLKRK